MNERDFDNCTKLVKYNKKSKTKKRKRFKCLTIISFS